MTLNLEEIRRRAAEIKARQPGPLAASRPTGQPVAPAAPRPMVAPTASAASEIRAVADRPVDQLVARQAQPVAALSKAPKAKAKRGSKRALAPAPVTAPASRPAVAAAVLTQDQVDGACAALKRRGRDVHARNVIAELGLPHTDAMVDAMWPLIRAWLAARNRRDDRPREWRPTSAGLSAAPPAELPAGPSVPVVTYDAVPPVARGFRPTGEQLRAIEGARALRGHA